jgi:mono/diheme cytochrome c family protein
VQKDTTTLCADAVKTAEAKALQPKTPDEKTISAEQKEFTFADLTKTCDSRGGYVQVHGACGGVNACQGFSYGDWGPGSAMLTEHSCTGVNGCAGLSCVVLPEEKNKEKSGAELYDLLFADTEPNSCSGCHGDHSGDEPDLTKFAVYVLDGSPRNATNWLERTAAEQERVVAFGTHTVLPDGTAMANMAAYNKVLSRKEIEKVVAHLRTLTPMIKVMKTKDQGTATPGEH